MVIPPQRFMQVPHAGWVRLTGKLREKCYSEHTLKVASEKWSQSAHSVKLSEGDLSDKLGPSISEVLTKVTVSGKRYQAYHRPEIHNIN